MAKKYANKERELLRKTVALRNTIWDFWDTEMKLKDEGFIDQKEIDKVREPFAQLLEETIHDIKLGIFNLENPSDMV